MNLCRIEGTLLRVLTAFAWLPFVLALVWIPAVDWAFVVLVLFLSFMGALEFFRLTRKLNIDALDLPVTVLAPLFVAGALVVDTRLLLVCCLFLLVAAHMLLSKHTITGLAVSFFGLIYAGVLPVYFIALHRVVLVGPALITLLIAVIGLSDTGAYAFGRLLGKHKLAPKISPNKTVEGSIAALICAGITGIVLFALKELWQWQSFPQWSLLTYTVVAVILSAIGQLGDLAESMLKRDAGVKDSGTLFPGHGGVLDRCDAFLFGGPVLWYLAMFLSTF